MPLTFSKGYEIEELVSNNLLFLIIEFLSQKPNKIFPNNLIVLKFVCFQLFLKIKRRLKSYESF